MDLAVPKLKSGILQDLVGAESLVDASHFNLHNLVCSSSFFMQKYNPPAK
jgi:hypothetical protein